MKKIVQRLSIVVMAAALMVGGSSAAYAQVDFDPATFLKDLDVGTVSSGQPGASAVGAPGASNTAGGPAPAAAPTVQAVPGAAGTSGISTMVARPVAPAGAPAARTPAAIADNAGPSGGKGKAGGTIGSGVDTAAPAPPAAEASTPARAGSDLARTGGQPLALAATFLALVVMGFALKRDLFLGR